jgi:sugar phosphate isomerase/epimerase
VQISVATANLFYLPFEETLEIIAEAGFQAIELDLYWERKDWAMAQHLKGRSISEVVRLIRQSELRVSSIHDGGGVLDNPDSLQGFINPQLSEYVDQLGYAPECIVFHTPHIEGHYGQSWWQTISAPIARAASEYGHHGTLITIENMPSFAGYTIPLLTPPELLDFVSANELGVTLDTTHYAEAGIDIIEAARILRGKIHTIHLSDYTENYRHVFVGDGALDFADFFGQIDFSVLKAITVECVVAFLHENPRELSQGARVERLKIAGERVKGWLPR